MSDEGYWWAWGVDAEAHRRVKRPFDRAARAAGKATDDDHGRFAASPDATADLESVWGVAPFVKLAADILFESTPIAAPGEMFASPIVDRVTPVLVLFHALGPQRASEWPGMFGNVLVAPEQVEETLARVERLLRGVSWKTFVARAWELGPDTDESLREVRDAFPKALRRARDAGTGLIGFTLTASALAAEHERRKA